MDQAFAQAVQNPKPEGISTTELVDLASALRDKPLVGFEVSEVVPINDQGFSATAVAKVVFEMLFQLDKFEKA